MLYKQNFICRITDNKRMVWLAIFVISSILSLGFTYKCNAALNDILYLNKWEEETNYYDQSGSNDNKTKYNTYHPNGIRWQNEYGENVIIRNVELFYPSENQAAHAKIAFDVIVANYTNDARIYVNGELEDNVKLIGATNYMVGYLRPDIFLKCGNYEFEVVAIGKDGKELNYKFGVAVNFPLVTTKQLIYKIENTPDNTSLRVEWMDLGKVSSYYVYRAKEKDGYYKLIGITNEPYLIDDDVEKDQSYYYRVVVNFAVNSNEPVQLQSDDVEGSLELMANSESDNNATESGNKKNNTDSQNKKNDSKGNAYKLDKPKIRIKKTSKTWQIYWGIISDRSTGIEIYMKNGHGKYKKFRKINTTTNIKKTEKKKGVVGITSSKKFLIKGVNYQFKARTFYYKTNGKKVYSKWSKIIKFKR